MDNLDYILLFCEAQASDRAWVLKYQLNCNKVTSIYIYIADACFTFPFFLVSITVPVTHVQDLTINVSEILALRTINVNKGKFTLEIGPLKGQTHALNTRTHCTIIHDTTTVKCARLPLFSILSD